MNGVCQKLRENNLKSEGLIVPIEIAMAATPLFSRTAVSRSSANTRSRYILIPCYACMVGLYPRDAPQVLPFFRYLQISSEQLIQGSWRDARSCPRHSRLASTLHLQKWQNANCSQKKVLQHPKILTNTEDLLLSMITKPVVIKQPMWQLQHDLNPRESESPRQAWRKHEHSLSTTKFGANDYLRYPHNVNTHTHIYMYILKYSNW